MPIGKLATAFEQHRDASLFTQSHNFLMTILIEAINIVVRCDSLSRLGAEGEELFQSSIPNQTFYSDGYLARLGFMDEKDALDFALFVGSLGLVHLQGEECVDFAIVLQGQKDSFTCKWLERFEINYQGTLLDVAAFVDTDGNVCLEEDPGEFVAPVDWSLDEAIIYHKSREELTYVKTECLEGGGIIDHYRTHNGKITCIGRKKRWFDLPFLCLLRMPLRMCVITSTLGALAGSILNADRSWWITGSFLGGLFGLVLCSQFAKEFPMTPLWIKKILGG